jgi:antitoxin YefM
MAIYASYSQAREKLASLLDRAADDRETVVIRRRGKSDVALIAADELAGLVETAYLLRSPKNAQRLLRAMRRAEKGGAAPRPLEEVRREFLGEE